jgi:hypothetical protein
MMDYSQEAAPAGAVFKGFFEAKTAPAGRDGSTAF